MTTTPSTTSSQETVELSPSYAIPIILVIAAIPMLLLQPWLALGIALFGVFLLLQTVTIRLQFTPTDLDVYRSGKLIRRFPYQDWLNWEIFWSPLPILFYFREVNSIHFLPIIFDAKSLRMCLEKYCGEMKKS
ncbi:MAG: DUF3119 family protein [Microcoleaceae cyanobacterium]